MYRNWFTLTKDIFYYGKKGSGKTLRAIIHAYFDYRDGREIWSNLRDLKIPNRYYTAQDLIDIVMNENYQIDNKPKTIIFDEVHTQADSRTSSSFVNRQIVNFISQCRKMGFDIIYVSQFMGGFDLRMRRLTDQVTRCIKLSNAKLITKDNPEGIVGFNYRVVDTDYPRVLADNYFITYDIAKWFFQYYNTDERIKPALTSE